MTLNISFEFFPPKTAEGIKNLRETALQLSRFSPAFFSVTFGAGGSTREGTWQTVQQLRELTSISVAPHLSCIGCQREDLIAIIKQYQMSGINRIIALRGDLPSGMGQAGELKSAVDLVKLIRETTDNHFQIDVAAYPEFHPQAHTATDDIQHLKNKINAGANRAITQYFFNADAYFYFLDECAKQNIFVPIIPGIMPITHFQKLKRFSEICGAEIPRWLTKRLESYHDDTESLKAFGLEVISDLCQRLIKGGAPGLHFYTLNHAEVCSLLLPMLGLENVTELGKNLID